MLRAVKVRLYPNNQQAEKLSQVMGSARWFWNYALNLCNQTYKQTGKGLNRIAINKELPKLKKEEETQWLSECYSQVLQSVTLNLTKAFKNFFEGRTKYPRFKSYHGKQSCQYPPNVSIVNDCLKIPQLELIKASIHRIFEGKIKTVTVSKTPTDKYFAIVHDGEKTSKYASPRHLRKHEKNLARKQQKLARKKKDSKKCDHVFLFLEVFVQEGGIQSYLRDVLSAYRDLNYKAEIFILRDDSIPAEFLDAPNLTFHTFKSSSPTYGRILFSSALLQCLLLRRPRHIFCGHIKLGSLSKFFSELFKIPYTVLTYGKEVWETLPPSQNQVLQSAQDIWTISRYSGTCTSQSNNINQDKIKILPCVVDSDSFIIAEKPKNLIEKYQLENNKVLLTVARLWSGDIYKGVDVTIRALPEILKVFPDVKYLVVGRGDDQPRLQQLSKDLGIGDKVIFAGFVPTEDLVAHYQVCDAYIMPSQEGFGIVYLEAMCCGKPVLSGDKDGSADPLQDGRLGWRVSHRDSLAVARGCIEILQGNDQRCDGGWLRQETIKLFSKQMLSPRLNELLE